MNSITSSPTNWKLLVIFFKSLGPNVDQYHHCCDNVKTVQSGKKQTVDQITSAIRAAAEFVIFKLSWLSLKDTAVSLLD